MLLCIKESNGNKATFALFVLALDWIAGNAMFKWYRWFFKRCDMVPIRVRSSNAPLNAL
jgi:hypothetical protein